MVSSNRNLSDFLVVGSPTPPQPHALCNGPGSAATPSLNTPMNLSGEESCSTDLMRKAGLREGTGEQ